MFLAKKECFWSKPFTNIHNISYEFLEFCLLVEIIIFDQTPTRIRNTKVAIFWKKMIKFIGLILLLNLALCFCEAEEKYPWEDYLVPLKTGDQMLLKGFDPVFEICETEEASSYHCENLQTLMDCAIVTGNNPGNALVKATGTCLSYFEEFTLRGTLFSEHRSYFQNSLYHIRHMFSDKPKFEIMRIQQKFIRFLSDTKQHPAKSA